MERPNDFIRFRKIGEYTIELPKPPSAKTHIANHDRIKPDQYFRRPDKDVIAAIEAKYRRVDRDTGEMLDPLTEEEEAFIEREFDRKQNGYWFYNNGNIEYLTGKHYIYLSYWHINAQGDGYPMFTDADRDFFYLWMDVERDENCYGLCYFTSRRDGKTHKSNCINYLRTTSRKMATGGIQSKTGSDAKTVFKKLVRSWRRLPTWLKPIDSGETNPQQTLRFEEPSSRKRGAYKEYKDALDSEINYKPSNAEAYDGDMLFTYFSDEFGKCLIINTLVLMHDGSIKKVQDICEGDLLMGEDSKPRTVTSLARGREMCYDVVSKKGAEWGCNESHILSLKVSTKQGILGKKKGETLDISVKDYLNLPPSTQKHLTLYRVPVEYPESKHILDPYVLGLWIGDGSHKAPEIHSPDVEIHTAVEAFCQDNGYKFTRRGTKSCDLLYIGSGENGQEFLKNLRGLNLFGNKHIPQNYLIDSRKNRLQLLAGLIDTDGYLIKNNGKAVGYEVIQKRIELARQIQRLALSLGFYASFVTKVATMKRKDGTVYRCEVGRVSIFGDIWNIPCKVSRKQAPFVEKHHKNRRSPERFGFTLRPRGVEDYYGFTLKENPRFLLHDFVVTHNTTEVNVHDRWRIVKETQSDSQTIYGKSLHVTTVEEMEKMGGKHALTLWNESDPEKVNTIGRTQSGLRRFFKPADYGYRAAVDRFGYTDKEEALKMIMSRREGLNGASLVSEKRKYPLNVDEAFLVEGDGCPFDVLKLKEQDKYNKQMGYYDEEGVGLVRRGNFAWKDGVRDTSTVWRPKEDGGWLIYSLPDPTEANQIIRSSQRRPKSGDYVAGCDPYDHMEIASSDGSNAACYIFLKNNPLRKESNIFVAEYIGRPESPDIFYEDVLMAMVHYSAKVLVETQKPGLINYMSNRGYYGYCMHRPEYTHTDYSKQRRLEAGISTSGPAVRRILMEGAEQYIFDYIGNNGEKWGICPFEELIKDWLDFDANNWTPHDPTVASMLALSAAKARVSRAPELKKTVPKLVRRYDNRGIQSIMRK